MFGKSQEFIKNLITAIISGTDATIVARLTEILYVIIKFSMHFHFIAFCR